MLRIYPIYLLLVVSAANKEVTNTNTLISNLLRLERTVAILSTKMESQLHRNTAAMRESTAKMTDLKHDFVNVTQALAKLQTDVAFEARLPSDKASQPDNVAIKFPEVVYNKGDGFRGSSGIFTAPVSGTYIFWAHIMAHDTARLHVFIRLNGRPIAQSHTSAGIALEVPSITTVVHLNKGDQVWFTKWGSSRFRGDNWSSYGGALLRSN